MPIQPAPASEDIPLALDDRQLLELCDHTLNRTDFTHLGTKFEGKVRDSYVKDDRRTIVVSDRVSAFDVVLGTVPLKGQILNQMAAFWFQKLSDLAPNCPMDCAVTSDSRSPCSPQPPRPRWAPTTKSPPGPKSSRAGS